MSQTKQDKLDELNAMARLASIQLEKFITESRKLRKEIWHEANGINIGDRVSFLDGKVLKTGSLIRIELHSSWVYPIVCRDKKDGSPGNNEVRCYDEKTLKKLL